MAEDPSSEHPGQVDLDQRTDYDWGTLLESDAPDEPYGLLGRWLSEAEDAGEVEFNSMALATVGVDGRPTIRNVLLRGMDDAGRLEFFTNYDSRKGVEIGANPHVGLLFSWLGLHRQVRVEGVASRVAEEVSDDYFASRPRESRIGAWASEQSSVLAGRDELEHRVEQMVARFAGGDVPRPPGWGGYGVVPSVIEFWQGRPSRLHDRLRYRRDDSDGPWVLERLAP